ncbi:MAG: outer membrane protein assembly factor [Cyanobacteria bacterium]|nr:outer membrane protein assembly factor [Cyanobacteriota bacterium]
MKLLLRCAFALIGFHPAAALAQGPPAVPSSATEPRGIVAEPGVITRAVLFADRQLGQGDLTNGIYVDRGNMMPGAGWLSAGPGYKHWYGKDSLFVDGSAAMSVKGYRMAQARVEAPRFLKSRLGVGASARWQDFGRVDYFDIGPATSRDNPSRYGIEATLLTAYATLRPARWMDIKGQIGWMNPVTNYVDGPFLARFVSRREFVPMEASATIDTRDFPGHPTSGIVLRGVAARYDDRTTGAQSFDQVEGEAAGFLPIGGGRVVLALHGWYVGTNPRNPGGSVPFYLQPSLGGFTTMRGYTDYRFHDDQMVVANAEVRLALLTHLDLATFVDAGNVAPRRSDLNFDRRSYGVGFRLHTRRETFATIDMARGDEGWRFLFRLKDPLSLGRLDKRTTLVPFVP